MLLESIGQEAELLNLSQQHYSASGKRLLEGGGGVQ